MELIPSLAGIFGVSTDILLGIPEQEKESAAVRTLKELFKASCENPIDVETVNCLIRDVRHNYLGCKCLYQFWFEVNKHALQMLKILPVVKLTAETILNENCGIFIRNTTIRQFAGVEDEDHIEIFLNKYAFVEIISQKELLYWRYTNLGNREKSDFLRQQFLSHHIDQLVGYSSLWYERRDPYDFKKFVQMNRLCLQLLHNVCCCTLDEKHTISDNETVDCWVEPRIWMGIQEAGCLASSGEKEKVLIVIEDTVSLMEKALKITSPTELRCTSPWLDKIVWIAQED